jgi:hypothetical protein
LVTKQEIERAIFIDFEGFETKPPTLRSVNKKLKDQFDQAATAAERA